MQNEHADMSCVGLNDDVYLPYCAGVILTAVIGTAASGAAVNGAGCDCDYGYDDIGGAPHSSSKGRAVGHVSSCFRDPVLYGAACLVSLR
jgi:hypothetical protein